MTLNMFHYTTHHMCVRVNVRRHIYGVSGCGFVGRGVGARLCVCIFVIYVYLESCINMCTYSTECIIIIIIMIRAFLN